MLSGELAGHSDQNPRDALARLIGHSIVVMSVHRKGPKWVVRYRDDAQRNRSRSFDGEAGATQFDNEASRRRQLEVIASR